MRSNVRVSVSFLHYPSRDRVGTTGYNNKNRGERDRNKTKKSLFTVKSSF